MSFTDTLVDIVKTHGTSRTGYFTGIPSDETGLTVRGDGRSRRTALCSLDSLPSGTESGGALEPPTTPAVRFAGTGAHHAVNQVLTCCFPARALPPNKSA